MLKDSRSGAHTYFTGVRVDLMELVPTQATRILDVGCGAGRLGEALKKARTTEPPRYVAGIKLHEGATIAAASVLDKVLATSVENVNLDELGPPASYDCIIFGDILEHLLDPWEAVRRFRTLLAADGVMVASIPNVGHWTVIAGLIAGRWEYRDRGLLDRTHVRFFTARSIPKLFADADMTIVRWERNYRLMESQRRHQRLANMLARGPLRELLTFQHRIVARPLAR